MIRLLDNFDLFKTTSVRVGIYLRLFLRDELFWDILEAERTRVLIRPRGGERRARRGWGEIVLLKLQS